MKDMHPLTIPFVILVLLFAVMLVGCSGVSSLTACGHILDNSNGDNCPEVNVPAVRDDNVVSTAVVPTSAAVEFSTTQVEIARAAMM